jgi:hypothetical protein
MEKIANSYNIKVDKSHILKLIDNIIKRLSNKLSKAVVKYRKDNNITEHIAYSRRDVRGLISAIFE